jgi:hypothetical protein
LLSFTLFGVLGLKRALSSIAVLIVVGVCLVSCGGYGSSNSNGSTTSGFGFRAFVSNPLQPTASGNVPVLNIVDAAKDSFTGFSVQLSGSSTFPGLMALTPNLKDTLVFSSVGNTLAVVDNASEAMAQNGTTPLPAIPLLGATESLAIWTDNATAFVAVPSAPVSGHPTGAVEVIGFMTGATTPEAVIPVAGAHYLAESHDGTRILVFSDNPENLQDSPPECPTSNCITLISPSQIGSTNDPRTAISSSSFDHPVWGIFSSDDSLAYIFNCGPQCGGTTASISVVDFGQHPPAVTSTVPVPAATHGVLAGNTLYVAGTPPGVSCPMGTSDATCGELTAVDTGSLTATASFTINAGYHDRVVMGANGQLFIGASSMCNSCLSIFNTATSKVVFPADNGFVTGIEPITDRSVVYVCENGHLRAYDTTTDQLQTLQVVIVGQAIDVKLVDPPGNFN